MSAFLHAKETQEKKKAMPFGVNLMRSQVLYRAAQVLHANTPHACHREEQFAEPEHLSETNHPVCLYSAVGCASSVQSDDAIGCQQCSKPRDCWSGQCMSLYLSGPA